MEQNSSEHGDPQKETPKQVDIKTGNIEGGTVVAGDGNIVNNYYGTPAPAAPQAHTPTAPAQPGSLPVGSYLPFTRNAFFTGREADLQHLEKSLLVDQTSSTAISLAIQGMGGIGKTQLAVEFAFRCGYRFKGVHWLDLRDPATLDSQIAQCGTKMMIEPWSNEQPEQVLLTLASWKRDGPRLLILDNFEDPGSGAQVLARLQDPNVRILVTTRRSDWPGTLGLRPLALEVFTEQESIDFLRQYTGDRFSGDELKGLANRLGCLPLALELAGRYLEKHPHLSIDGYLRQVEQALDDESMRGYRKEFPNATGHDLDLLSSFALSWQQVTDEAAQKTFIVAAYCAPNTPIPLEIFERTLELDPNKCDEALGTLQGLGLLKDGPAIHPLLAEYGRSLDKERKILSVCAKELASIAIERSKDVDRTGKYSLFTPLLPHLRAVAEIAETHKIVEAASLWNDVGYHIRSLADFTGAKAAYERSVRIGEAAFGPDHPEVAIYVNNLGGVLRDLGELAGARAAYERALKIDEAAFGPDHPKVAIRINNLGGVLQDLGDLEGARAAYERALKIDEAAFGPDHPKVAIRINNLGAVLNDLGNLEGARAAYERALKIDEAAFGPDHPKVAIRINNLGSVLQDTGDLAGARAAFERALKIDEAVFGPEHPRVARDVNNLGSVLHDLGELAGARAAFERALKIDEAAFGAEHPNVATDVDNLGAVLDDLGDLAGARAAYERALRIDEAAFGPDHTEVATDVSNLGSVLKDLGELAGARAAYERALKIHEAALGPDHPEVATDVNNLGSVLYELGDLTGARAAFERALRIIRQFLPEGHPKIKITEGNLRFLKEQEQQRDSPEKRGT